MKKYIINPTISESQTRFETFQDQWNHSNFILFRNAYDSDQVKHLARIFGLDSLFPVMRSKYSVIDCEVNDFIQQGMFHQHLKNVEWIPIYGKAENFVDINGYMFEVQFCTVQAENIDFPIYVTQAAKSDSKIASLNYRVYNFISLNLIRKR